MKSIKETIISTAMYYGYQITKEVLAMHLEDLEGLQEDEILKAYRTYRRHPKNRSMPLPAQIRAIIEPDVSDEIRAIDVATRIEDAIHKFGYMQPEAARDFIGDIGWNVVARRGGWSAVCEDETPIGIRQKHYQQSASAIIETFRAGEFGSPPTFDRLHERRKREQDQRLLAGKIKDISEEHPEAIGEIIRTLAQKKAGA